MAYFAVIGLGRFGSELAKSLAHTGAEVIAIDRQARQVDAVKDQVTLAVRLDSTDAMALRSQGVSEVDAAIVGIGNDFESTALTVAVLSEMGIRQILARAETQTQAQILKRVGATSIIYPEGESAERWAHRLALPSLEQYVELGEGKSMVSMSAPPSFHDRSVADLQLRREYGANLVAIQRRHGEGTHPKTGASPIHVVLPEPDTVIEAGDVLVLIGANEDLSKLPAR